MREIGYNKVLLSAEECLMAKLSIEKTNVMRLLDQKKVPYTPHTYPHGDDAVDGVTVAQMTGMDSSGKDYNKFEEMKLTPGKAKIVNAPIIEESPLCIECRVKEIISLGSHDMFIADVVNVKADDKYLNGETGKFELSQANPLVYVHGGYFELGPKIGKFGWSVEKNRMRTKEKA